MKKIVVLAISVVIWIPVMLGQGKYPNLIPYRKGDLWGYCDSVKKIIVQPRFDAPVLLQPASYVSIETAFVSINNKKGLLDKNGIMLIACEYDEIDFKFDSVYIIYARKGKAYYKYSIEEKKLIPYQFPQVAIDQNETLEEILEAQYYFPPDSNISITSLGNKKFDVAIKKVIPYSDGTSKLIRIDSVQITGDNLKAFR